MNAPFIHPNTPPKLVAKFKKCGYVMRKLADELGINMFYISQLITHGAEPTDKTQRGREIRVKLFLPRRVHKSKRSSKPMPDYLRWWKQQDRRAIIKQLYELNHPHNKDKTP